MPAKYNRSELAAFRGLALEYKVALAQQRIIDWYQAWNGRVYIAFSGGKDSTVLLHLARHLYPDIPAIFADTGLEYPEVKDFVRAQSNIEIVRPKYSFKQVLDRWGYPVASKEVSNKVGKIQKAHPGNVATVRLYLTGYKTDGTFWQNGLLAKKWRYLINAPFKISDHCCLALKKRPLMAYERATGRKPITGTMSADSNKRELAWLRFGCNTFSVDGAHHDISAPLSVWTQDDIWSYIKLHGVPISSIYSMGEQHTGCIYCAFGVHFEESPNRFERMAQHHPKLHSYCMQELGLKKVLDFMGTPSGCAIEA